MTVLYALKTTDKDRSENEMIHFLGKMIGVISPTLHFSIVYITVFLASDYIIKAKML